MEFVVINRDFVYIKGDFSETYNKAVEDLKEYNNRGLEYRNPDKNPKYSLFGLDGSNCTQETIRLFSLGKLNNGETVDNYLKNNKFNASILPNKNMNVLQQLFYNKACNAREAEKDIKEAERDNETRVKNSNGYFYYINKKNLEAIS